jgi:membrane protease subunit (stomatin/prohibitin family)
MRYALTLTDDKFDQQIKVLKKYVYSFEVRPDPFEQFINDVTSHVEVYVTADLPANALKEMKKVMHVSVT